MAADPESVTQPSLGQRVRALREGVGWTQKRVAELAGLSTRTVVRVEKDVEVTDDVLRRLAGAFSMSVEQLREVSVSDPSPAHIIDLMQALKSSLVKQQPAPADEATVSDLIPSDAPARTRRAAVEMRDEIALHENDPSAEYQTEMLQIKSGRDFCRLLDQGFDAIEVEADDAALDEDVDRVATLLDVIQNPKAWKKMSLGSRYRTQVDISRHLANLIERAWEFVAARHTVTFTATGESGFPEEMSYVTLKLRILDGVPF